MKRQISFLLPLLFAPALMMAGCNSHQRDEAAPAANKPVTSQATAKPAADKEAEQEADDTSVEKTRTKGESGRYGGRPDQSKRPAKKRPRAFASGSPGPAAGAMPESPNRDGIGIGNAPKTKPKDSSDRDQDSKRDDMLTGGDGPRNMYFKHYGVNPTIDTEEEARSTFSVDVDTASYTMTRSFLSRGQLPNEAAVRVEEMVNAFDYGYEPPRDASFSVHAEAAPSPNRKGYHLLHVGVKGKEVSKSERKDATLVFVVDVSGSMDGDNRLALVKKSLRLLVGQLTEGDKVGIVTYGSDAREVLQPTSAFNKQRILNVVNGLTIEGATNAEAGLRKGYAMAARHMKRGDITRVVLCSDGVANVGKTGPDGLLATIRSKAKEGITISTVGFGMGNYNDVTMERLANGGNGNYYYVDKLAEAKRVFVEQLTGTLQVIAKDTKIQLQFDPKVVSRYRLIGYENRALTTDQFSDDRVDAGEIGAGHAVTAIYEIKLRAGATGALGKVRIRHKQPQGSESALVERELPQSIIKANTADLSSPSQLAMVAAQFAEKLRGSYWARNVSYDDILRRFDRIKAPLRTSEKVVELRKLVAQAKQLDRREDKFGKHGPIAQMTFDRVPILK